MKRLLTGFFILVFLFSCGNRKTKMDPFATITEMVDSAGHEADTLQPVSYTHLTLPTNREV